MSLLMFGYAWHCSHGSSARAQAIYLSIHPLHVGPQERKRLRYVAGITNTMIKFIIPNRTKRKGSSTIQPSIPRPPQPPRRESSKPKKKRIPQTISSYPCMARPDFYPPRQGTLASHRGGDHFGDTRRQGTSFGNKKSLDGETVLRAPNLIKNDVRNLVLLVDCGRNSELASRNPILA